MKISLYRFLTTFCIVPTFDWGAFAQRVFGWATRAVLISAVIRVIGTLFSENANVFGRVVSCNSLVPRYNTMDFSTNWQHTN